MPERKELPVSKWIAQHDGDGDFAIYEGARLVAITDADTEWDADNARVIAAAHELLESLRCSETLLILLKPEIENMGLSAKRVLPKVQAAIKAARPK